jgi:hypothetical protein
MRGCFEQLAEVATLDSALETRTSSYQSGMIERIGQEIAEAEAEKSGCLAEVNQRRDVGSRMEQLAKSGWASQIRTAEAFATKEANVTRCEMANAKIDRFKIERNSAQTGVFLRRRERCAVLAATTGPTRFAPPRTGNRDAATDVPANTNCCRDFRLLAAQIVRPTSSSIAVIEVLNSLARRPASGPRAD